jgi:hypothetical protein
VQLVWSRLRATQFRFKMAVTIIVLESFLSFTILFGTVQGVCAASFRNCVTWSCAVHISLRNNSIRFIQRIVPLPKRESFQRNDSVMCYIHVTGMDVRDFNPEEYHFSWRPLRFVGGSCRLKANVTGGRRALAPLNHSGIFRKSMRNLSQGSRVMSDTTSCIDLVVLFRAPSTALLRVSPPPLTMVDLRQSLVGTVPLQLCQSTVFPASAKAASELTLDSLMWSAKSGIPKFSRICCYKNQALEIFLVADRK